MYWPEICLQNQQWYKLGDRRLTWNRELKRQHLGFTAEELQQDIRVPVEVCKEID